MAIKTEKTEFRKSARVQRNGKKQDPRSIPREAHPGFITDSTGQLELAGIDTPIGKLAEDILIARITIQTENEKLEVLETAMIVEMKKDKIDRFKHKGEYFILQPAKKSEEKLQIKKAE